MLSNLLLCLLLAGPARAAAAPSADLQFFGDLWLTAKAAAVTDSTAYAPRVFAQVSGLLRSAKHNIVNLEGVISDSAIPFAYKRYQLDMPRETAAMLAAAGIDYATLANNHIMDYGFPGLLATMNALTGSGVGFVGAGINRDAAEAPLVIDAQPQAVCLLAFSRTLPANFWATKHRAGTAYADTPSVVSAVERCSKQGFFTVVAFHWGQENLPLPLPYQQELAHAAIDAGARLIVGHHPHRLQRIEVFKGRPIFYSLGNFAFGSEPSHTEQEGLAVRVTLPTASSEELQVELVPLQVRNGLVHFQPRVLLPGEPSPVAPNLPPHAPCTRHRHPERWTCAFAGS